MFHIGVTQYFGPIPTASRSPFLRKGPAVTLLDFVSLFCMTVPCHHDLLQRHAGQETFQQKKNPHKGSSF